MVFQDAETGFGLGNCSWGYGMLHRLLIFITIVLSIVPMLRMSALRLLLNPFHLYSFSLVDFSFSRGNLHNVHH